ncbi:MAG TPA: NADH-quinone oxidoreductase subunit H [Firmicutes bacterium]|nr:NADH-quinone oxidoreductase subunit H [Bacillota bacterium]
MNNINGLIALLLFPSGLFIMAGGLAYQWIDRKLVAQLQNRIGPRWFQPFADVVKLLVKEEVIPEGANPWLFQAMPILALASALTAVLYVPMFGLRAAYSFPGDLIVTVYLMSVLTISIALAGTNTLTRFSLVGATRALTQLFCYEAPFLLALLGPAIAAGSWQIGEIAAYAGKNWWMIITQPVGFFIAMVGLMGKLELPPFDAPEAETEIVAGALTEYSGRGYALFRLAQGVELIVGLTLISLFYLGGISNPLFFIVKTLCLLFILAALQALLTRLRIDQTVGLWWRFIAVLGLLQFLAIAIFATWRWIG